MPVRHVFAVLLAVVLLAAGPARAATLGYSDLYVFGDSLSDTGRAFAATGGAIPPTPPYFRGQFTGPDGPVWAGLAGDAFRARGKGVRNYAVGSARALGDSLADMPAQVGLFGLEVATGAVTPGRDPLAAFWFGANDIFAAIPDGNGRRVARRAANAMTLAATTLRPLGVDSFLFFSLPDLSTTPLLRDTPLARDGRIAARVYNRRLGRNVDLLRLLGFDARIVDVPGLIAAAEADPAAFGLANLTDPCVIRDDAVILADCTRVPGVDASTFLWFDLVHPGSRAHAAIAEAAVGPLAPVPLPAALPMSLAGVALLGAVGWRRR